MTNVNLSYDYIAAFFLLMLLIWYFTEKKVPLRSYRYFAYVLVTAFGATVLEILAYKFVELERVFPYQVAYTALSAQMLCIHSFITCIANYLLSLAYVDSQKNPILRYLFVISWIIIVFICGLNPFFMWAANLEGNVYTMKGIGFVLYGIDAVMVALMGWVLIAKRQNFKFLKKTIAIFLFVCTIVAGIAQELQFAPMLNLAIALFCLVLYLFGQGPEVDIDKTTGQFSRKFFGKYLKDRYISKKAFSLLVIDLDDFRLINQSYGVATGDVLLQQVGEYLENMHKSNTVFHHGADQFCVVIDKGDVLAKDLAEAILKRFEKPWVQEKLEIMMSATVCVFECPGDADKPERLVEIIDYTMEMAKSINKGRITYASELDLDFEKSQVSKNIERAVKDAIAGRSIMVYYQPIYSVEKQCYNSAEALARLYDEKLGWIAPDVFITTAEKTGLIIELGEMIIHKVCNFIKENDLSKTTIKYIDINISPLQLLQKGFAKKMLEIMKQYEVEPWQINVEITETAMMTSSAVVSENLKELVKNNISISLDDYGSGYASINYINSMPFKTIKLDKDIVQASFEEHKARITMEHTIRMLNALELSIIAEGVETQEMKDELVGFGCHYLQGWYYSKAVPEEDFMKLINV